MRIEKIEYASGSPSSTTRFYDADFTLLATQQSAQGNPISFTG